MFDLPLFLLHGAFCLAAIGCAWFVRPGRTEAVILGAGLLANFIFCALAYTPYAPKYALQAIGIDATSKELWALADTLLACSAAWVAFDRWWGWALAFLGCLQLAIHASREAGWIDGTFYSDRLGNVLLAQLAIFFFIGGRGLADLLHSTLARCFGTRRFAEASRCEADEADL